ETQGHTLILELSPEPLYVEGDLTRLTQVFGNLLNNAAKYTDPGGSVYLRTRPLAGDAEITVRDTGIGIPPEQVPHLFEMFSQIHPAMEQSKDGLGIGLSLVQGLVKLHGGSVDAFSAGLGQGSLFRVLLPLLPPDSANHPSHRPPAP